MYIQYTSIDLASLLIYQVSRVILLQWLFPLLQKHLVSGLGSTLGFFTRAAADLPFHEVSLLALALLETSGFTNHQQLMLLLDFYFRGVKHREYLKDHHIYPWYVIVHHEALAAWWQWLWRNITISSGRSTPTWFKWLLHSDNLSTSSTIELLSLVCRLRKSSEVSYLLTWARAWNPNFSPRNISYVPRRFEIVFGASILNRLTELSRSHQNVYVRCSQHPQTTFEVQHTERCIKDISLLWSNEDNPQFTDLVRIIATINFQLNFL